MKTRYLPITYVHQYGIIRRIVAKPGDQLWTFHHGHRRKYKPGDDRVICVVEYNGEICYNYTRNCKIESVTMPEPKEQIMKSYFKIGDRVFVHVDGRNYVKRNDAGTIINIVYNNKRSRDECLVRFDNPSGEYGYLLRDCDNQLWISEYHLTVFHGNPIKGVAVAHTDTQSGTILDYIEKAAPDYVGTVNRLICECGKEKHGFASHSDWCDMNPDKQKERT